MKIILLREPSINGCTLGRLFLDGSFMCDMLEDVVRPVKVHGETAIPYGTYKVIAENSPRFGQDTLTLVDVPGYKYIRIHAGNTAADTEGCLLPGTRSGNTVTKSRIALDKIRSTVLPALKRGEHVTIEIRGA